LKINSKIYYSNFGFIPIGDDARDRYESRFGHPNLIKRVQAKGIIHAMNLQLDDVVLDFGCGVGFVTVELAKEAAKVYGVDINPYIEQIAIPDILKGKLEFIVSHNDERTSLPFPDNFFNKILISEVYITLPDPVWVSSELLRVLKDGGSLIVVNTLGRIQIEKAYARQSRWLSLIKRFSVLFPATYEDYVSYFFNLDRLNRKRWFTVEELTGFLKQSGFNDVDIRYPFKNFPLSALYWWQFVRICLDKGLPLPFNFVVYWLLDLLSFLARRSDPSTVIITGTK